jgi:hypothetical protein
MDVLGITDAIVSHAMASGRFEQVNGSEPQNPPSTGGLTAAVWVDRLTPQGAASGLNTVSAVLVYNVRIYASAMSLPSDAIDPDMLAAVDDLCGAYCESLDVRAGYLQQDGALYRVLTIALPVVVNDLWNEVA